MPANHNIPIRCDYTELLQPEDLQEFQGDLKKHTPAERRKLKDEIKQLGFTAPLFLWFDTTAGEKTHKVLDGHQRLGAVTELLEEGFTIADDEGNVGMPVIYIKAATEEEAADILLGYNTAFAKISTDGLVEFAQRFNLDLEKIKQTKPLNGVNFNEVLKKLATLDSEAAMLPVEPEYEIVANFQESYNSVIIFCTNEMDWASLKEMLQLPTMKSYKNSNVGTARVIPFTRFKQVLEGSEPPNETEDGNEQELPFNS